MSRRLRLLPYRKLAELAEAAGFKWVRCRGSHNTFRSADGQVIVIPDLLADVQGKSGAYKTKASTRLLGGGFRLAQFR